MSKRMNAIKEKVDNEKAYETVEAMSLLKEVSSCKFDETVESAFRLGVDVRKNQVVRGTVMLPHGSGKDVRVAVCAQGQQAENAKAAGADIVGFEDLIEKIKAGEMNFDVLIASPEAMRLVGQVGQVLGPRGLMPNPKTGTVTPDVETAVKNAKSGQVAFRTEKAGIVHVVLGKINFTAEQLKDNLVAVINEIKKLKPAGVKGIYIKKIGVSSTMGPGLNLDLSQLDTK